MGLEFYTSSWIWISSWFVILIQSGFRDNNQTQIDTLFFLPLSQFDFSFSVWVQILQVFIKCHEGRGRSRNEVLTPQPIFRCHWYYVKMEHRLTFTVFICASRHVLASDLRNKKPSQFSFYIPELEIVSPGNILEIYMKSSHFLNMYTRHHTHTRHNLSKTPHQYQIFERNYPR